MNKNLIIRADASTHIGTGHIMRCIAFAQAWQDKGGSVTFLSHCDSEFLRQRIRDEGFKFISIERPHPDLDDFSQTLTTLKQLEIRNSKLETWVVLDGYHFTPNYQKAIRENGYRLLVIDDTAHLDHYHADILLNQNIHAPSLPYSCDMDTVELLGCKYVMLRREFLKYKDWKREIPEKPKKILVTMGGSDPDNVTFKIIKAFNYLEDANLEAKVVAGPANPNINSLEKELHFSLFTFHLLPNTSKMPEVMAWADMSISAGGSTCWELAFMGVPMILIVTADNQKAIASGLDTTGVAHNLGWFSDVSVLNISQSLNCICQDHRMQEMMNLQGKKLIDGNGALRVLTAMKDVVNESLFRDMELS